jgi:predicted esterase
MKLIKDKIDYQNQQTNIFYFLPDESQTVAPTFAIFCHGYTADKSSILNWALRLAEVGVSCALFDLPGHYLGNFSEVESFDHFKNHAQDLFLNAFNGLNFHFKNLSEANADFTSKNEFELVLGGHSLGALLALKALNISQFKNYRKRAIGVGIGMAPKKVVHLFDTPFYKATLLVREQLVSPELNSKNVFPWIRDEKENMNLTQQKIHLITGVDDLVVGDDGMERFCEALIAKGNKVTFEKPTKLPHHEPNLASGHIKKYFKDNKLF